MRQHMKRKKPQQKHRTKDESTEQETPTAKVEREATAAKSQDEAQQQEPTTARQKIKVDRKMTKSDDKETTESTESKDDEIKAPV